MEVIAKELRGLTSHRAPDPSQWVFSSNNQIFRGDKRTGDVLAKLTKNQIWDLLRDEPQAQQVWQSNALHRDPIPKIITTNIIGRSKRKD